MSDCNPTLLFGQDGDGCNRTELTGCTSPVFEVTDHPVLIRAFNLIEGEKIFVEMVAGDNEGEFFEMMKNGCGCSIALTQCNNNIVLTVSGRYRLNRCACPDDAGNPVVTPDNPAGHVEYQPITTGVVVNHGETNMACGCETGSTVTAVTQPDGSTILTIDGTPIVLPAVTPISAVDAGDSVVLTIDGTAFTLDKGFDDGASVAALFNLQTCGGAQHQPGAVIPTCNEMDAAIATAVANAADTSLTGVSGYNPATNEVTFNMSDGSTVVADFSALVADALAETQAAATVPLTDAFGVAIGNIFP